MLDRKKTEEGRKNNPSVGYRAMKAIRAKCLDCCAGQQSEVDKCESVSCSLWPLRYGKQPRKDKGTFHAGRVMAGLTVRELADARVASAALNADAEFVKEVSGTVER
jgi:hypothetical protein